MLGVATITIYQAGYCQDMLHRVSDIEPYLDPELMLSNIRAWTITDTISRTLKVGIRYLLDFVGPSWSVVPMFGTQPGPYVMLRRRAEWTGMLELGNTAR